MKLEARASAFGKEECGAGQVVPQIWDKLQWWTKVLGYCAFVMYALFGCFFLGVGVQPPTLTHMLCKHCSHPAQKWMLQQDDDPHNTLTAKGNLKGDYRSMENCITLGNNKNFVFLFCLIENE